MNAGLEGVNGSPQRVDRQCHGDIGSAGEALAADERQRQDGGRGLRAVDQRQPLLRFERHRLQPGNLERPAARPDAIVVAHRREPLADEHEREVRERRQVAARTHRAAARHDRMHPVVEQVEEMVDRLPANAGEALREDVGSERHRCANGAHRERFTDTGGMAAEKIQLERLQRVAGNRGLRQRAEPGVDAVDGAVGAGMTIDDGARRVDALNRVSGQRDVEAAIRNVDELGQRERATVTGEEASHEKRARGRERVEERR